MKGNINNNEDININEDTIENVETKKSVKKRRTMRHISLFIILMVVLRIIFVFTYADATSESMSPTIETGDLGFCIRAKDIERFDIVGFVNPDYPKEGLVGKRVIGLPGDEIKIEDGNVYVNGTLLDETAYLGNTKTLMGEGTYEVPENCYFLMGDNRENSFDSRFWTNPYISRECIRNKEIANIYPLDRFKLYSSDKKKANELNKTVK